jgi:hypothetical protein
MSDNPRSLMTAGVVTVLIIFALYRRVRRSVGRQPYQPRRLAVRAALLALVCAVFAAIHPTLQGLAAAAIGAGLGAGFGFYALRHTRFESAVDGKFYTPHPYIGLAVAALLIARIAYRFTRIGGIIPMTSQPPQNFEALNQIVANPLTMGVYFVMAGYYVYFYVGVISAFRAAAELESAGPI